MNPRPLWVLALLLAVSCAQTVSYQEFEVIHDLNELRVGDEVRVEHRDGQVRRGTVESIVSTDLKLITFTHGKQTVRWSALRLVQRVKRVMFSEPY